MSESDPSELNQTIWAKIGWPAGNAKERRGQFACIKPSGNQLSCRSALNFAHIHSKQLQYAKSYIISIFFVKLN
jgi:hypothetical protein